MFDFQNNYLRTGRCHTLHQLHLFAVTTPDQMTLDQMTSQISGVYEVALTENGRATTVRARFQPGRQRADDPLQTSQERVRAPCAPG